MSPRRYHAPVWDEPVVHELGRPGSRAWIPPQSDPDVAAIGTAEDFVPAGARRSSPPALPELSEFEVQRHYVHLSQMTLGMMGVSLFGTCTMKYNPRVNEHIVARPWIAEVHPHQDESTVQGSLEVLHAFNEILCELSGMDQFVFQAGGGAHAAYTHACVTRAYHASRGELQQRNEVITTIQAHPCNAATAAAAGFKVVTLPLEEEGYASVEALKAAVSDRTAALMVNNPDDMGVYNPHIAEWIQIVHDAGGLCFYDHANFNGVMSRIRAREIGFDGCMYMLHKTFAAPKGGGGPATGAYGVAEHLIPFLPRPLVTHDETGYHLDHSGELSIGKVREFWGNVPVVVKAYSWARSLGAEGIRQAADLSVLMNHYMQGRLLAIRGISKAYPGKGEPRLEMIRYGIGQVTEDTGITIEDVQNRMVDFGIDAPWLAHEPWFLPQPFTPESGELWSKEDVDLWIDVLERIIEEAYEQPEVVRSAPHAQSIHRADLSGTDNPAASATTWRTYRARSAAGAGTR